MGSSNREYMQDDGDGRGPSWGQDIPTTKWLIITTAAVFLLQTLTLHGGAAGQISYIEEWFWLDANKVLGGQIWRLVTYVFCHSRDSRYLLNFLFNLVGIYFMGASLERIYGSREILCFYLASSIVCGAIFTAFQLKFDLPYPLMGAGPGIAALLSLYATHFPRQQFLVFGLFPIEVRFLVVAYVVIDLYGVLQAFTGQTAWFAMAYLSGLWGIAFGYLYRRMDWRVAGMVDFLDYRRILRSMRQAASKRNLKVYHPEPTANLDEQVDAILAKIHEQGSESLTDRERVILQKASEQAKNRH